MPNDHEVQEAVTEEIEEAAVELAVNSLSGDLADALYSRVKRHLGKCSEADQRRLLMDTRTHAREIIREAVRIVAGYKRRVIPATVKKVDIESGIKTTLTTSRTQQALLDLGMAQGNTVLIVVSNEEQYLGDRNKTEDMVDPDQPNLLEDIENQGGVVQENPDDDGEESEEEAENTEENQPTEETENASNEVEKPEVPTDGEAHEGEAAADQEQSQTTV